MILLEIWDLTPAPRRPAPPPPSPPEKQPLAMTGKGLSTTETTIRQTTEAMCQNTHVNSHPRARRGLEGGGAGRNSDQPPPSNPHGCGPALRIPHRQPVALRHQRVPVGSGRSAPTIARHTRGRPVIPPSKKNETKMGVNYGLISNHAQKKMWYINTERKSGNCAKVCGKLRKKSRMLMPKDNWKIVRKYARTCGEKWGSNNCPPPTPCVAPTQKKTIRPVYRAGVQSLIRVLGGNKPATKQPRVIFLGGKAHLFNAQKLSSGSRNQVPEDLGEKDIKN